MGLTGGGLKAGLRLAGGKHGLIPKIGNLGPGGGVPHVFRSTWGGPKAFNGGIKGGSKGGKGGLKGEKNWGFKGGTGGPRGK